MNRHFLVYVTANDVAFFQDYVNLYLTRKHHPGFPKIELCLVVSEVKPVTWWNKLMLRIIMDMAGDSPHMDCKALLFKSNVGRDFGSVYQALQFIKQDISPEDFIMVRNRSTRGPSTKDWYKAYVNLMESSELMSLVGSRMGFRDHPRRKREQGIVHVQTYVYLSRWKYLSALLPAFPGIQACTHHEAVFDGEIELSQQLMRLGGSISCLQFPGVEINAENQDQYYDYAAKHNAVGKRVGPIFKRPRVNAWTYYFQILPILITIIAYIIPRKRQYRVIGKDMTKSGNKQQQA